MPVTIRVLTEELRDIWHSWTGGQLYIIDQAHIFPNAAGIPAEILAESNEEDLYQTPKLGKDLWWKLRVRPGWSLIASAEDDTPYKRVLPSWAALLRMVLEQEATGVGEMVDGSILKRMITTMCTAQDVRSGLQAAQAVIQQACTGADVLLIAEHSGELLLLGQGTFSEKEARACLKHGIEASSDLKSSTHSIEPFVLRLDVPSPSRVAVVVQVCDSDGDVKEARLMELCRLLGLMLKPFFSLEVDEQQQRLTHDLALAAAIQSSLFPDTMPIIQGYDLAADLLPARQVGGDFFDVCISGDGRYVLAVGDVAGKGASASILTAVVHAVLHSESPRHKDPASLLETINAGLYPDLDRAETFVTMTVAFLNPDEHQLEYASAGHVDGMLWKAREETLSMLPATGLPLGIYPSSTYAASKAVLEPGDVLGLYTDGITEAEGLNDKLLGVQGLADLLFACHLAPARAQLDVVLTALEVHRRDKLQRDDVALLLCRCLDVENDPRWVKPFVVAAHPTSVHTIVNLVRDLAMEAEGVLEVECPEVFEDFALALAEVIANQIKHAYQQEGGRIQGRLVLDKNTLSADTFDYGSSFQPVVPLGDLDPEDPPEGGYGMQLIDALTDRWAYTAMPGGRNHWSLQKRITGVRCS